MAKVEGRHDKAHNVKQQTQSELTLDEDEHVQLSAWGDGVGALLDHGCAVLVGNKEGSCWVTNHHDTGDGFAVGLVKNPVGSGGWEQDSSQSPVTVMARLGWSITSPRRAPGKDPPSWRTHT